MNTYNAIGTMSGTSLDGLDIAMCHFQIHNSKWKFEILNAQTFEYDENLRQQLNKAHLFSGFDLMQLDTKLARLFADCLNDFIKRNNLKPDFISSHGHTIFHQPHLSEGKSGFTTQIGSGSILAALTGCTVVSDFRSSDVALGGQGAPLVPIGDQLLFHHYDYCLNLGGIANISFNTSVEEGAPGLRLASDVCYANMALNYLAANANMKYDNEGELAGKGLVDKALLKELNNLDFHHRPFPKSTGKEYFEEMLCPLLDGSGLNVENKLRTFCEHIICQIKTVVTGSIHSSKLSTQKTMLVTGGGTFNTFLITLFKENLDIQIVIPEKKIIEFKEALIFAFLGVLRMRNEINVLSSVTGASRNSCSGAIYKGGLTAPVKIEKPGYFKPG